MAEGESREETYERLAEAFDEIVQEVHHHPNWAQVDKLHGIGVSNFAIANALHDVADAIRGNDTPAVQNVSIEIPGDITPETLDEVMNRQWDERGAA